MSFFSRHEDPSKNYKLMDKEITMEIQRLFVETYQLDEKTVETFGFIFSDELTIALSIFNPNDPYAICATFMINCEYDQQSDFKEKIALLIDGLGSLLDTYFSNQEDIEFQPEWSEIEVKKSTLMAKFTRENIHLTLEADSILLANPEDEII